MILVTGGTGFVGSEIVRQLVEAGHRVRVLSRHPEKARELQNLEGVEIVAGDALEPTSLSEAMRGVTAVIHLIGILFETDTLTYEQAHRETTQNVLKAASAAGVRRFLQMSALGVRADAGSRYHRTKWEAEELVRQSGLDWTILRPSLIYGPGDKSLNAIATWLTWPRDFINFFGFPYFGDGSAKIQPVPVAEVAQAFVRALSNSAAVGKTYDVCGPVPVEWRELLLRVARREGVAATVDSFSVLYALRCLLWTLVFALPLFLVIASAFRIIVLWQVVIGTGVWAGLAVVACLWRRMLFFPLPWPIVRGVACIADKVLPRAYRFGEPLKMLAEDNVGDPMPAQKELHLKPQPLFGA
jgi:uncharacterized protein YbjT (DUF2867 family)